ncbi:PIN domain-containing protein [Pseudomonas sp. fls2-241-R2A-110]|uniref:PIN domain-containing protein n=1 Tax=Pseudomonas sp. fls2-241-R2A-110 TaxID=3040311 RepID=UPI002556E593|nr:PIN domain-containing protein [Pseudomonas sp. fls2-241-R2A-110]
MEVAPRILYVFPDTNVFVQCKQLEALDWNQLGQYDKIMLVVTRPVITEVDNQKGGPGRLAKRARNASSLFRRFLLEGGDIEISTQGSNPNLVLMLGQHFEPSEELNSVLNYNHADDNIVGIAHAYQQNHNHDVVLLSHDTGPLLMSKRVGVPFRPVPDDWLLTAEHDEEQKRIRELEADLTRIKKIEPQCNIAFNGTPWKFTRINYIALNSAQLSELIEILKSRNPISTSFGPTEIAERSSSQPSIFGHRQTERFVPATEEEISKYKDQYIKWVNDCCDTLAALHESLNKIEEKWVVSTTLVNTGGSPATSVNISFESLSKNFGLMELPSEDDDIKGELTPQLRIPPHTPEGRWVTDSKMPYHFGVASRHITAMGHEPPFHNFSSLSKVRNPNSFYWKDGRPGSPLVRVEFECEQWRHQDEPETFELRLVVAPGHSAFCGAIQASVHAANIREPVKKVQSVEFVIEDVEIFSKAKELVLGSPLR